MSVKVSYKLCNDDKIKDHEECPEYTGTISTVMVEQCLQNNH